MTKVGGVGEDEARGLVDRHREGVGRGVRDTPGVQRSAPRGPTGDRSRDLSAR
jgi:hypothetical protein